MLVEGIVRSWQQARESLIAELEQIPAEEFDFRPSTETRSVAEIIHHVLAGQRILVAEICQSGHDINRQVLFGQLKQYGEEIAHVTDKEGLISRLKDNMKWTEETVCAFGEDGVREETARLDGTMATRFEIINFMIGHEMYHWGQISVYERLLGIEPALTARFKRVMAAVEQKPN